MSDTGNHTWQAAVWAPPSSPTGDLVAKALADAAAEPAETLADLSGVDVAVVVGLDRLGAAVRRLPPNVPLAVLPQEQDLVGSRQPASAAALLRHGSRVNVVVVEGDRACRRLAALRVRIPVAMHGNDATVLAGWLHRAHAYGYLCGRRRLGR